MPKINDLLVNTNFIKRASELETECLEFIENDPTEQSVSIGTFRFLFIKIVELEMELEKIKKEK